MCSIPAWTNRPTTWSADDPAPDRATSGTLLSRASSLAALGCDDSQMSCGRIHVVKQGRAIAQLAVIQWTGPCHRHQNVGVGRQCRSWPRRALLPAGKDCNVVANVGEH